jgi:anthranilate synthase/aminodeoxychorismate synthase-like glutamine amidotransferase
LILLIDNYDSFTFNLRDYILQCGVPCDVIRNDDQNLLTLDKEKYKGVVLSPGPGRPEEAGLLMKFIDLNKDKIPILGVCLGHQALGLYFGVNVIKAEKPMHGKISVVSLEKDPVFQGLDKSTQVVRYHSLVLSKIPVDFLLLSQTENGEIMAMKHQKLPIYGFQFHPEAVMTTDGRLMIKNWVNLTLDKKIK